MALTTSSTDPTKLPVQFNIKVPWDFREFLRSKAATESTSLNALVSEALAYKYGAEFARHQAQAPK